MLSEVQVVKYKKLKLKIEYLRYGKIIYTVRNAENKEALHANMKSIALNCFIFFKAMNTIQDKDLPTNSDSRMTYLVILERIWIVLQVNYSEFIIVLI